MVLYHWTKSKIFCQIIKRNIDIVHCPIDNTFSFGQTPGKKTKLNFSCNIFSTEHDTWDDGYYVADMIAMYAWET